MTPSLAQGYEAWLINARHAISSEQHIVSYHFTSDSTVVSFDTVSGSTVKILPEQQLTPE